MLVFIKGTLTDIRKNGETEFSYVYDNSSEPTLYRVKGKIDGKIGESVSVQCRVTTFKDKLYLSLEDKK